jgi:hypothetical protein
MPQILKKKKKYVVDGGRGRIMEGRNKPEYKICIYGNVTKHPLYNY